MAERELKLTLRGDDKLSPTLRAMKGAITDFNQALEVAGKVARTVGQIYEETVGDFIQYADQVDDLSSITGRSAEETSRLLTVMGDFGVGADQVTVAMRAMRDEGLTPTLDTIAQLSDQYLALAPGIERANFLQETFGRSGANFVDVLEQGSDSLRERAGLVADGNVLTAREIRQADELRVQLAELNDSYHNITRTIAVAVIPACGGFVTAIETLLTSLADGRSVVDQWNDALREMPNVTGRAGTGMDDFSRAVQNSAETNRAYADGLGIIGGAVEAIPTVHTTVLNFRAQLDSLSQQIIARWGLGAFATILMRGGQYNIGGVVSGASAVVGMSDEELGLGGGGDTGWVRGRYPSGTGPNAIIYTQYNPSTGQYRRAAGGPVEPVTLVGEQGQELIINGVVVPHEETERLLRLGLVPDQEAMYGGGGGGIKKRPENPATGSAYVRKAPFIRSQEWSRAPGIGEGGEGGAVSPEVAAAVEQTSTETAATVLASMPAAIAQAASEQSRALVEETRRSNDETNGLLRQLVRAYEKQSRALPVYIRDAVERTL